jgi:hypothetical protein
MNKTDLVIVAAVLAVLVFTAGSVKGYLDLPTVYYSQSGGKAVLVEYSNGVRIPNPSSSQVPSKYVRVVVK